MLPLAAFVLIAPPVGAPSGDVSVQGRTYELPTLPKNLEDARRNYSSVRLRTEEALRDLEKDIQDTYGIPVPKSAFTVYSTKLVVSPTQVRDVLYLCRFIQDPQQNDFEKKLFQTWSEWQVHLLGHRMNHDDMRPHDSGLRLFPANYADYPTPGRSLQIYASSSPLTLVKELVFVGGIPGISANEGVDYRRSSPIMREAAGWPRNESAFWMGHGRPMPITWKLGQTSTCAMNTIKALCRMQLFRP
jgi:hypothetical protein